MSDDKTTKPYRFNLGSLSIDAFVRSIAEYTEIEGVRIEHLYSGDNGCFRITKGQWSILLTESMFYDREDVCFRLVLAIIKLRELNDEKPWNAGTKSQIEAFFDRMKAESENKKANESES